MHKGTVAKYFICVLYYLPHRVRFLMMDLSDPSFAGSNGFPLRPVMVDTILYLAHAILTLVPPYYIWAPPAQPWAYFVWLASEGP